MKPHPNDPTPAPTSGHTTKVTVIRIDTGQPFIADAQLVTNADGSVSFQLPDGKFAGQDPAQYGTRADGDATQQYQRALARRLDGHVPAAPGLPGVRAICSDRARCTRLERRHPRPSSRACLRGCAPSIVPPIARPPLPEPLPNPTRDGAVWATTLPLGDAAGPPRASRCACALQPARPPAPPAPTASRSRRAHDVDVAADLDRDYLRGDAWGVTMPDAPIVSGVNPDTKDLILSWFLDRYPLDFQKAYLAKYAGYGYTHLYLSPPDSIQGAGRTLGQFVDTCRLVRSYGLWVGLNMASKVYQPAYMDPEQFAAYIDPLLDVLLDEADEFVPAWEWDLWNRTAPDAVTIMRHRRAARARRRQSRAGCTSARIPTSWFCRWRSARPLRLLGRPRRRRRRHQLSKRAGLDDARTAGPDTRR